MAQENLVNSAFAKDLESIFGPVMTELLMEYLKKENAICENGMIDAKKLGLAFEALFGEVSLIFMQKLLLIQKKAISAELR